MSIYRHHVAVDADTAGGTQVVNLPAGFGVPVGVRLRICLDFNATDSNVQAGRSVCEGLSDGTNHRCVSAIDTNGQSTTVAKSKACVDRAIVLMDFTQPYDVADLLGDATVSFGPDKVNIEWQAAPAQPFRINMVVTGGPSANGAVGNRTTPTFINTGTTESGLSFKPHMLEVISSKSTFAPVGTAPVDEYRISQGWAIRDGADATAYQGCIGNWSKHSTTLTDVSGATSVTRAIRHPGASGESSIEITAWSDTGFTATTRDVGGGSSFGYLAIGWGDAAPGATITAVQSTSATGDKSYSGLGITPDKFEMLTSDLDALDTNTVGGAGGSAFAIMGDGTNLYSMGSGSEGGLSESATYSYARNTGAWNLFDGAAGEVLSYQATPFESDKINLNFTTARADAYNIIFAWADGLLATVTGDIVGGGAVVEGTAGVSVAAAGDIVAGGAVVDGAASVEVSAAGEIVAGGAVVDGAAGVEVSAAGEIVGGGAVVDGAAGVEVSAAGEIVGGGAVLTGEAATVQYITSWLYQHRAAIWGDTRPHLVAEIWATAGEVRAHLYDEQVGAVVPGSEISVTDNLPALHRSAGLNLTEGRMYRARFHAVAAGTGYVHGSALRGSND